MQYPSWSPRDVKEMSVRERQYWSDLFDWKNERQRSQMSVHS